MGLARVFMLCFCHGRARRVLALILLLIAFSDRVIAAETMCAATLHRRKLSAITC